jgi:hypothetical protein
MHARSRSTQICVWIKSPKIVNAASVHINWISPMHAYILCGRTANYSQIKEHIACSFRWFIMLKALFAGLLWEKNTAGWLLISPNEQGDNFCIRALVGRMLPVLGVLSRQALVISTCKWNKNPCRNIYITTRTFIDSVQEKCKTV